MGVCSAGREYLLAVNVRCFPSVGVARSRSLLRRENSRRKRSFCVLVDGHGFPIPATVGAGPKWIGVKAHYRERDPAQSTDLYFFDHGYCGVQPVSADAVNVCALVRSDSATTSGGSVRVARRNFRRGRQQWERITAPVSTAPVLYRKPICLRDNMLLAGDAAGFIDPFAGDGISLALRSGKAAAECLACVSRGRRRWAFACQNTKRFTTAVRSVDRGVNASSQAGLFARNCSASRPASVADSRGAALRDQEDAGGVSGF